VDIVVKGRNVEVPEHYRQHVAEKLAKVERYDGKIIRVDVELSHEKNPRQSDRCQRLEITCVSRGPVVRAEACSGDFYSALDHATAKLDARLRRNADRRRVHRGQHAPISVAAATSGLEASPDDFITEALVGAESETSDAGTVAGPAASTRVQSSPPADDGILAEDEDDQPWHIVRMKEHPSEPMTVDDALFQMELVGHDFFLFLDKESARPCVVYRRRAYDYGVITLVA
jgi:ribosomal subunit interface protein